jgi:rod shape-determining protein MreC
MLLITDASSKIPVAVERTGTRAFLAGDNTRYPKAVHFEKQGEARVGDVIITSGMDGKIPAKIPVGIIGTISEEEGAVVQPFIDPSATDYVKIIKTSQQEDIAQFLAEEQAKPQ